MILLVRRRVRRKLLREGAVNNKVQDYRFVDEKRKNIPDAGLASFYRERRDRRKYEYDPHLDPQLVWAGKAEHTSFEVDIYYAASRVFVCEAPIQDSHAILADVEVFKG